MRYFTGRWVAAQAAVMTSRTTQRPLALVAEPSGARAKRKISPIDLDWHPLLLAAGLRQERGDPRAWRPAPQHAGLGTAIIDAVMTPRVTSATVERVVQRYTQRFGDSDVETLLASFADMGAERWRTEIGTSHRVVQRTDAPYKCDTIALAATLLREHGVVTNDDLLQRVDDDELRAAWCALPGQSSGFTWRHLLLAAGLDEPLVCPLTRRFTRRHLGRIAAAAPAHDLVAVMKRTARLLDVSVLDVDHQMWRTALTPPSRREHEPAPSPAVAGDTPLGTAEVTHLPR